MPEKQTKKSKRGNTYRTTHLTKEEKMVAETLYKAGIDFSACTPSEAVEWHREVAKKGWAPAQYNLACCYANGKGVERNMKEAAKLFEEAAKQGHPEAQCRLGLCYEYGEGVKQDKEKAVRLYRKAAAQWEDHAQFNLGCCYADGQGVQRDEFKAAQCFYKAARRGNQDAKDALRRLLDKDVDE